MVRCLAYAEGLGVANAVSVVTDPTAAIPVRERGQRHAIESHAIWLQASERSATNEHKQYKFYSSYPKRALYSGAIGCWYEYPEGEAGPLLGLLDKSSGMLACLPSLYDNKRCLSCLDAIYSVNQ
jgi:hypothetical protein